MQDSPLVLTPAPCPALTDADYLAADGRPWIAPALFDTLFGPDPAAPRTYLIVDAALRAEVAGDFDLDAVDVPVLCLYKGDAAERMREVAPYVVDLTLEGETDGAAGGAADVPRFHRDFFAHHAERETGILLRSSLPLEAVQKHFRRFTKVLQPSGKAAFFRFWEPRLLTHFLAACTQEELLRLFPAPQDRFYTITKPALPPVTRLTEARLDIKAGAA